MTDAEKREAFTDGITRRDIRLCGSGGMSLPYWQERRRGGEARDALEKESSAHYIYGPDGEAAYFYGDGAA